MTPSQETDQVYSLLPRASTGWDQGSGKEVLYLVMGYSQCAYWLIQCVEVLPERSDGAVREAERIVKVWLGEYGRPYGHDVLIRTGAFVALTIMRCTDAMFTPHKTHYQQKSAYLPCQTKLLIIFKSGLKCWFVVGDDLTAALLYAL